MWRRFAKALSRNVVKWNLHSGECSSKLMASAAGSRNAPKTTSSSSSLLKDIIFDKIKVSGPITVAEYMKLAASAYYSSTAAATDDSSYGIGGDFVTSPEISQMFGELVGVWCAYESWKMGNDRAWQMVELGPGNGSLMLDCMKTLRQVRASRDADRRHQVSVHLVEMSDALAARQERLLCSEKASTSNDNQRSENDGRLGEYTAAESDKSYKQNTTNFGSPIFWYKDLSDVPRRFSFILAHEFFDALPVHKFQRTPDGKWREVCVDADLDRRTLKFALARSESVAQRALLTKDGLARLPSEVDQVEISPDSVRILEEAIERITEEGGAILLVDYGYDGEQCRDTLRAFRKHHLVNDFLNDDLGSYDITADVNFGYLKRVIEDKACCFGPIPQGEFLRNLGIEVRLKRLLEAAKTDEERDYLRKSFDMLVDENQMGSKFKVMAIFPKVLKPYLSLRPPSGFCDLV